MQSYCSHCRIPSTWKKDFTSLLLVCTLLTTLANRRMWELLRKCISCTIFKQLLILNHKHYQKCFRAAFNHFQKFSLSHKFLHLNNAPSTATQAYLIMKTGRHINSQSCGVLVGHWIFLQINTCNSSAATKLIASFCSVLTANSNISLLLKLPKIVENLPLLYFFNQNFAIFAIFLNTKQFIPADSPSWAEQNSTNNFVVACTVVEISGH